MSNKVGQVGREMGSVPFGDLIKNIALGIAEGQFALDKSSIVVTEFMSGNRLLRDLDTGELLDQNGQVLGGEKEVQFLDSRVFFGYEFKNNGTPASGKGNILYVVDAISIIDGGSGYTSAPQVTIAVPGGDGVTASAEAIIDGMLIDISVGSAGTGYVEAPMVSIRGGGGSGATAVATVDNDGGVSVAITSPGSGYTSNPTVTIEAPKDGGTQATATAMIDASVVGIRITNPGKKYSGIPTITIDPPTSGGSEARASAGIDGQLAGIALTQEGSQYDFPPDVEVVGDGSGATARALVDKGRVTRFEVTSSGSGYTQAEIIVSGGKVPERVPRKLSMMELGFTPNFYQFVDTVIEIKITVNMIEEETESKKETPRTVATSSYARYQSRATAASSNWWRGVSYRSSSRSATYGSSMVTRSVDPAMSSKYNYSVEGSSSVRTKLVPVPPPAILEERIRQNMDLDKEYQELLLKK